MLWLNVIHIREVIYKLMLCSFFLTTTFYDTRPVPAGIKRPTTTFSFKPRKSSSLPVTAASVNTRGFLERCSRNERVSRKRRFSNTHQLTFKLRRELVCARTACFLHHADVIHLLAFDEACITAISDINFTQHLTYNHFNVLCR